MANNNNKQQQQQQNVGTTAKTSLRELSEFHPRLSMRAAVSNKINEDALSAIQLQQQPSQSPKSPGSTSISNESQGNDLIQSLTRFVGSDGLMKESVDLQGYAELMQCEVGSSHQILFLKILVATLKSDSTMSTKMVECEALMVVLGLWLSSVDQEKLLESVLVEKILEILSRLNFNVELLVKYKFGRVIKKITQQKEKISPKNKTTCLNFEMATKLFDSWSAIANKSEIPNVPRRKSEEDIEKKEEIVIEIVNRPESPINIEKPALKRSSITVIDDKNSEGKKTKYNSETKKKKSVKFPEEPEELCKVILFERAPEEYGYLSDGSASRDSYLHADVGEASLAFNNSMEVDDYSESLNLKPWKELEIIEGIPSEKPDGIDSEEKIIQHQRERSVLSVNYYSFTDIPPNPSEEVVDTVGTEEDHFSVKIIPIRPNEKIIKQKVTIKQPVPSLFVPPELFTNFTSFNKLLNPFASNTTEIPSSAKVDSWMKSQNSIKTTSSNLSEPEFDSLSRPSSYRSEHKSSSGYKTMSSTTQSSAKESEYRGYSAKSICSYYRPGKPFSCRLGSSCRFIHQD